MHIGKGRGRGRKEGRGDDGDLVQVYQKGSRWREDGCNPVMDPLSPSVFDLHPFAKTLALELLELA